MRRDTRTGIVGLSVSAAMIPVVALEVWALAGLFDGRGNWAAAGAVLALVLLIPANALLWWWLTKTIGKRFDA